MHSWNDGLSSFWHKLCWNSVIINVQYWKLQIKGMYLYFFQFRIYEPSEIPCGWQRLWVTSSICNDEQRTTPIVVWIRCMVCPRNERWYSLPLNEHCLSALPPCIQMTSSDCEDVYIECTFCHLVLVRTLTTINLCNGTSWTKSLSGINWHWLYFIDVFRCILLVRRARKFISMSKCDEP